MARRNVLVAALAALTLTIALAPAAEGLYFVPRVLPGQWALAGAMFLPDPSGLGVALRLGPSPLPGGTPADAAGAAAGLWNPAFGVAAMRMPAGVQIAEITTLQLDTYSAVNACGGGSPRWTLTIDEDGNGAADGSVHVYGGPAPNFHNCAANAWVHRDLLDGAPRWDSTQFGGAFYGSQASAQAAAGPDHQVVSAIAVWDSSWLFGPTEVWFDNLKINCFRLGEAPDLALDLAAGQGVCV